MSHIVQTAMRPAGGPAAWILTLALAGCYTGLDGGRDSGGPQDSGGGSGDGDGDGDGDSGDGDSGGTLNCDEPDAGFTPMRRLTRAEYANSVADLLGIADAPVDGFPADESIGGFESNNVAPVTQLTVEAYMAAAEDLAARSDLAALVPCDPSSGDAACGQDFIAQFGRRAFRRPLTDEERNGLQALFDDKLGRAGFDAAARLVLEALLQAPAFLYRPELGPTDPGGDVVALTGFEMASRLSYFLWASTPDDELLDAAQAGELDGPDGIATQAERMLADARAARTIRSFHRQWLGLSHLEGKEKDEVLYPEFTPALRDAMEDETLAFVENLIFEGDRSFDTLLTANYSMVNDAMAQHYGLPATGTDAFVRVDMPDGQRSGVLTHASFLTAESNADQASPILRGKTIRQRLLCQVIPDPPPGLELTPPVVDPTLPTRERFEQHSSDPACKSCHQLMDPIGFGFLHYDAIGAWVDEDAGIPVDPSGEIVGSEQTDGTFVGALELGQILVDSPEVHTCMARQWMRYGLGRPERDTEACSVEEATTAFNDSDRDIVQLIGAIVQSDAFRHTRITPEGN